MNSAKTSREILRNFLRKGAACVACAAVVTSIAPVSAFADYAVGLAAKAGDPLVDELGMDEAEGTNPFVDYTLTSASIASAVTAGTLPANANEHYIFGTGKTDANDTFTANLLSWRTSNASGYPSLEYITTTDGGHKVTYTLGGNPSVRHGSGGGPAQAYNASTDATFLNYVKPAVIVGNGNTSATAPDVGSVAGYTAVEFSTKTTEKMLATVTAVASEAYAAAGSDSTKFRYGNPNTIATEMTNYYKGMVGYVKKQIADQVVSKPTVAVVTAYDSSNESATIAGYSTALETQGGQQSNNRYAEVIKDVANNIATDVEDTADLDDLGECDFVLVSGSAGADDAASIAGQLQVDGVSANKIFYTSSRNAGALYGVVMNSVENLQNYGRILPFIFPSLKTAGFTQDAALSYYVRHFYHVKSTEATEVINALFNNDGVQKIATADNDDDSNITYVSDETTFAGILSTGVANF